MEKKKFNFINDEFKIDFKLTRTMKNLIEICEQADLENDYGKYMNFAFTIDTQAKYESGRHIISDRDWALLQNRYPL